MSSIRAAQSGVDEKYGVEIATPYDSQVMPVKEHEGVRDVAADLFFEIGNYSPEELESERAIVRRKLDLIIMPMLVTHGHFSGTADHLGKHLYHILPTILGQALAQLRLRILAHT